MGLGAAIAATEGLDFLWGLAGKIALLDVPCDPFDPNQFCDPENTWELTPEGKNYKRTPPPGSKVAIQFGERRGKMIEVPESGYESIRNIVLGGGDKPPPEVAQPGSVPEDTDIVQPNEAMPRPQRENRKNRRRGDPPGTTREIIRRGDGYRVERVCRPKRRNRV